MPELPEVESVRRSLAPLLIGRTVVSARLLRRDILIAPGDPTGGFSRQRRRPAQKPSRYSRADLLQGSVVADIVRRGKQLAIITASRPSDEPHAQRALGVQLGMTGHLFVAPASTRDPSAKKATRRDGGSTAHVHAVWTLDSGDSLKFHDPRRFGSLRVFRGRQALDQHWSGLGPDALAITAADLAGALREADRSIKAALLDQSVLAGVGNIYADEALFLARINPLRTGRQVTTDQAGALAAAIRSVLSCAIDAGGSTLRDYADAQGRPGSYQTRHLVYGRSGLPCTVCGSSLRTTTVAQRTTVWCPQCQPGRFRTLAAPAASKKRRAR